MGAIPGKAIPDEDAGFKRLARDPAGSNDDLDSWHSIRGKGLLRPPCGAAVPAMSAQPGVKIFRKWPGAARRHIRINVSVLSHARDDRADIGIIEDEPES